MRESRIASRRAASSGAASLGTLELAAREVFSFVPQEYALTADGQDRRVRPLLIAIANARQYGNGALIAPEAQLDDGKLDLVVVDDRPAWRVLMHAPKLFSGSVARVPGVSITKISTLGIVSDGVLMYHVDGEPYIGGRSVKACVHPRVLRVLSAIR